VKLLASVSLVTPVALDEFEDAAVALPIAEATLLPTPGLMVAMITVL
jgi:hypothetical protein